jgi:hypothetical protein
VRGLVAGIAGVGLLVACSSSSGSNASSASGFAQQYCALIEPCCADAGLSTSGQACNALLSEGAGYNAANGQACLDATKQAEGTADFCTTVGGNLAACKNVFSSPGGGGGTVQPGQPCKFDTDCAPGSGAGAGAICYFSSGLDGGTSEVCVQTLPGKAGQMPCVETKTANGSASGFNSGAPPSLGYVCNTADGVACNFTTHACTALAATGQTCATDVDCVTGDYCNFAGAGGDVCAARLADGASCAGALGNACQPTSICDTTSQTCVAGLPSGAACTSGEPCASRICANGKCSSSGDIGLSLLCGN